MKKKPTAASATAPLERNPNTLEMFDLPADLPAVIDEAKAVPMTPAARAKRYRAKVSDLQAEINRLHRLNAEVVSELTALLATLTHSLPRNHRHAPGSTRML